MNCKFNTLPGHAQTPAHSASCRGSGGYAVVWRFAGAKPDLDCVPSSCSACASANAIICSTAEVYAPFFEISHIDAAMHRILFKQFEKGIRRDCAAHLFCQQLCDRQPPLQIKNAAEYGTIQCPARFRSLAHLHFLISKIFSCKLCKNRPACAPSIWVW